MTTLALDVMYHDLDETARQAIEAELATWVEFEVTHFTGSWVLAKWGGLGTWALYIEDEEFFQSCAEAYHERLMAHFTDDGVGLVGANSPCTWPPRRRRARSSRRLACRLRRRLRR